MTARLSDDSAPKPEITGYVEAVSADEVVGWAWRQGSSERLQIELRCGGDVIASATADTRREDLLQNGVGDGCHAFRLAIAAASFGPDVELVTVAIDALGNEQLLSQPPSFSRKDSDGADLKRNVELLIGSQRVLHRNLQAALLKQGPSLTDGMAEIAATQKRLDETLATLELFHIRLEDRLQVMARLDTEKTTPRLIKVSAAFASLACLISCVALWRALGFG